MSLVNPGYNWATSRLLAANSTNSTLIKAGAGAIGFIFAVNVSAAVIYLKLYDKATAPTVGTDTPIATLPIPGLTTGAGFMIPIPAGAAFNAGLGIGLTTGIADNDTGAPAASSVSLWIGYA